MRDIDLIPADYVQARQVRRLLVVFGAALLLLVLATAGLRGWIAVRLHSERAATAQARQHDSALGVQRARLATLRATRDAGDAQLATLDKLLDARPADALWNAVDGAYNPRIWLEALSYARTVHNDAVGAPGSMPGAPAPVPATAAPAPVLALRHDVELRGHALDHAALSEFRRALGERPGVVSVRLAESGLQQFAARDVVRFTMTATLAAAATAPATVPATAPTTAPATAHSSTLASTGRAP